MYGGEFTMNGGTINAESGADVVNVATSEVSATAKVTFNDGNVILCDATDDGDTSEGTNKSYAVYVSNGSATVTVAADMDIDNDDCGTANETTYVTFNKETQ